MWVVLSNLENDDNLYWQLRTGNLGWDLVAFVKDQAPHVQAVVRDGFVIGGEAVRGGAGAVLTPGPDAHAEAQADAEYDNYGMR